MKEEVVKKLMDYLSSAETFLGAEIPDLLQQILAYDFYSHLFYSILWLAISLFFIWLSNDFLKQKDKQSEWGWCTFLAIVFFVFFCIDMNDMLKISTAPKYYLLCKLKEIVK